MPKIQEKGIDEKEYIINVDLLIKIYNDKNPKLKPLTRDILAKLLGVKAQVFSDWKRGKTPRWVNILFKMVDIGKCNFDKFIIEKQK